VFPATDILPAHSVSPQAVSRDIVRGLFVSRYLVPCLCVPLTLYTAIQQAEQGRMNMRTEEERTSWHCQQEKAGYYNWLECEEMFFVLDFAFLGMTSLMFF
jgi:hypothetical protein